MKEQEFTFIAEIATYVQMNITNVSEDVAYFIGCQFALESNYGKSELAKKHNNYCGMKFAKTRPRTGSEIKNSLFAHYVSLRYCLLDYFLCLAYHRVTRKDFETIENFSKAINNWYCPDGDYINKINSIYQQFKSLNK